MKVTQTYYMKDADGEYFVAQPQPTLREMEPEDIDDTMSVAERVVRIVLAKAKGVCLSKVHAIDHAGNSYLREASATQCANAIGALNIQPLIDQVQGILSLPTTPEPPADVALDAGDLERLRMQLAACTTAALLNTRETMAERITADNPYYSATYADVCRAVDREVEYREKLADVVRDAERYRWLRDKCRATGEHWGGRWSLVIEGPCPDGDESSGAIDKAIDAAIKRQGGE